MYDVGCLLKSRAVLTNGTTAVNMKSCGIDRPLGCLLKSRAVLTNSTTANENYIIVG